MKPFDLELAKQGHPLITRDGHLARIVCFDRIDKKDNGHLLALLLNKNKTWEMPVHYTNDGIVARYPNSQLDLFINE